MASPYSSKTVVVPEMHANRRRRGYELTRQRDMLPIALGAGFAALVLHVAVFLYAPSIILLPFSTVVDPQEKVEDEMTTVIRLNTLLYLVFILFAIHILLYLPEGTIRDLITSIKDFFMGDFGVLALTYAILFKIMIWINMWRMRNEE